MSKIEINGKPTRLSLTNIETSKKILKYLDVLKADIQETEGKLKRGEIVDRLQALEIYTNVYYKFFINILGKEEAERVFGEDSADYGVLIDCVLKLKDQKEEADRKVTTKLREASKNNMINNNHAKNKKLNKYNKKKINK